MITLNPRQKTALVVMLAMILTVAGIHNPTEGYINSHLEQQGVGTYEWQGNRQGCTSQLHEELIRLEQERPPNQDVTSEWLIAMANGPKPAIYRKCMSYRQPAPTLVEEPFLSWVSSGALHPLVATTQAFLVAAAFILLWGACFVYALRTSPRPRVPAVASLTDL